MKNWSFFSPKTEIRAVPLSVRRFGFRVGHQDRISVPCVTLDRLFADKQVDFIKVDVEGAELRVMPGAQSSSSAVAQRSFGGRPTGHMQRDLKPSAMFLFMAEQG